MASVETAKDNNSGYLRSKNIEYFNTHTYTHRHIKQKVEHMKAKTNKQELSGQTLEIIHYYY